MRCVRSSFVALVCLFLWTTVVAALPHFTAAQKQHVKASAGLNHDYDYDATVSSSCDTTPRAVLQQFLKQQQTHQHHERDDDEQQPLFKIQGWRWHTMSLIRESSRLATALQKQKKPISMLQTAVDYVVDFNLRGLDRIQSAVFFPWVRQEITQRAEPAIATAFCTVMDELEAQAATALTLGQELQRAVAKESPDANDNNAWQTAVALRDTAQTMLQTEETLLIPLVAHYIPALTQSRLNQRVLATLGVWDSRLHLVGMHETIQHDAQEMARFQHEIPYLARSMIGRWKRLLYDPRVAALDE